MLCCVDSTYVAHLPHNGLLLLAEVLLVVLWKLLVQIFMNLKDLVNHANGIRGCKRLFKLVYIIKQLGLHKKKKNIINTH